LLTIRSDPFPFEAVRDLIGILRALYAATPPERVERRRQIAAVAGQLRIATEQARKYDPGTMGFSAAWKRAEEATIRLTELLDVLAPIAPVLEVAGKRVRRMPRPDGERERKRWANKLRR
jgi:hypothetical protein